MNRNLLFAAAFMLAHTFYAQEAKPVVVVSATGKVSLLPQGQSTAQPLQSGAVAKNTGKLVLGKKSRATLYCDGQFKEVSGKSTIDLSTVCGNNSGKRIVNADYDFGEKLMAAVEMVAVAQKRGDGWVSGVTDPKGTGDGWGLGVTDPKGTGDGWGLGVTDPKGTGDGWGGKGSNIRLIMPFGKLRSASTVFSWSKPANTQPFKLTIQDESGKTVLSTILRDTFARIDLSTLNLSMEQIYRWKVEVEGANSIVSNEFEFALEDENDFVSTVQKATTSPLAKSSSSLTLRRLVEAVALENNEWYYEAQKIYGSLQTKSSDNIVRIMYGAFWMRYGFKRLAEKATKGQS